MSKSGRGAAALIVFLLAAASWRAQAACSDKAPLTTPTARFVAHPDRVYDRKTKLTWSRCPVGMKPQRARCVGSPKLLTHLEAQAHATRARHHWRLPSLEELEGILEERCAHPAINAKVFPDVVELYEGKAKYWSATPMEELPGLFYNLDFMEGIIDANTAGIAMGVRLVRGVPAGAASPSAAPQGKAAGKAESKPSVLNALMTSSAPAVATPSPQGARAGAASTPSLHRQKRLGPTLRRVIRNRQIEARARLAKRSQGGHR